MSLSPSSTGLSFAPLQPVPSRSAFPGKLQIFFSTTLLFLKFQLKLLTFTFKLCFFPLQRCRQPFRNTSAFCPFCVVRIWVPPPVTSVTAFPHSLLLSRPLLHLPPQREGQTLTQMRHLPLRLRLVPDGPWG